MPITVERAADIKAIANPIPVRIRLFPPDVFKASKFTPTVEITQLPVFPNPTIITDSMETISLNRPGSYLVERVAEKISSIAAKLVARVAKVISNGINLTAKGSEKFYYQGRRRPRCPHGYRLNDTSRHCDCGKFRSNQITATPFKTLSTGSSLANQLKKAI